MDKSIIEIFTIGLIPIFLILVGIGLLIAPLYIWHHTKAISRKLDIIKQYLIQIKNTKKET